MKLKVTRSRLVVDLPAGEYSLGDPEYAIGDEKWDEFLEGGQLDDVDAYFVDGTGVAVPSGSDGGFTLTPVSEDFDVDSGLIGVVPGHHEELIPLKLEEDYVFVYGIRNGRIDIRPAKRSSTATKYSITTQ